MVFHQASRWIKDNAGNLIPRNGEQIGDGTQTAKVSAFTTDDLDIGSNDFVASGDVLPIASFDAINARDVSTTSTSFVTVESLGEFTFQWDFPANVTTVVAMGVRFQPGTDETMTGEFRNFDDGESMVSVTGTAGTNTQEWSGWTQYTPTTTDSALLMRYRHKVDNGVNSSASRSPTFWVGIQL